MSVLTNLAADQTLTIGLVPTGTKKVLVRAVGPTLQSAFALVGSYADPRFTLINQLTGTVDGQNDNWDASLNSTFTALGAFSLAAGSKDAAALNPVSGPHTVQVNGSGSGLLLVELYDADKTDSSRLFNVSARSQVGTGSDVLVAGFIIDGNAPATVLIRGIGPALLDLFGINGAIADPKLTVYQNGTKIAENDNWNPDLVTTFDQVGAFRFKSASKDSALLLTLPPGSYTAQVSGVGNVTGNGIVELYVVP